MTINPSSDISRWSVLLSSYSVGTSSEVARDFGVFKRASTLPMRAEFIGVVGGRYGQKRARWPSRPHDQQAVDSFDRSPPP